MVWAGAGQDALDTNTRTGLAERVIATLRGHEAELRRAGILRLSLFGSVARGDAGADSDVDLVAELEPEAGIGLIGLSALERRLAGLLGRPVDLLPAPLEKPRLRADIERDGLVAFWARPGRQPRRRRREWRAGGTLPGRHGPRRLRAGPG